MRARLPKVINLEKANAFQKNFLLLFLKDHPHQSFFEPGTYDFSHTDPVGDTEDHSITLSHSIHNLSKPLESNFEALLKAFLEANPDQTFFDSGMYQFNGQSFYLSHALLRRHRYLKGLAQPQIKYDVLEPLDQGAFGIVYASKRTLTLGKKSLRGVDDNHHIVKMTSNKRIGRLNATPPDEFEAERQKLTIDHRSRPKKFTTQHTESNISTFLTMRRFRGQTLEALFRCHSFTAEQRYKLSITLLRALKEQVHDLGMIHRDIKPANIIVDINTMEVNIIDFGLSMMKDKPDGISCGSPLHKSPEVDDAPNTVSEKSDIYSMGIVLAELWGSSMNMPPIRRHMIQNNPDDRHTVNDLISEFHDDYLAQHYTSHEKAHLSTYFNQGARLRTSLIKAKDRNDFLNQLSAELHNIIDDPHSIQAFTHGLGWHALQGAASSNDAMLAANKIIDDHHGSLNQYVDLLNQTVHILTNGIIYKAKAFSEFRELFFELNHKLKRIEKRPFDFDWLQKSTESLNTKFKYWNERLVSIKNDNDNLRFKKFRAVINDISGKTIRPLKNQAIQEIDMLRNALRIALTKYVKKTFTCKNIFHKDRAASKRRQNDISDFNGIIENTKDVKSLLDQTKRRMSSIETGWLFRSKLKSNLEKVIEQHEGNTRQTHKY